MILSSVETGIHDKIKRIGTPLKDWDININYGVKIGYNEAFIINGQKQNELIAQDPKSEEIIRPILRGRDIKRYGYVFSDLYVILAHFGSHKTLEKEYPAIFRHLRQYESMLKQRGQCRYTSSGKPGKSGSDYPGQHHWLELDNNPTLEKLDDFSKQKIVWGNLNLKATYCIVEAGMFISAPSTMIVPASKYLLAILNSKLADYYIRNLGVTRNGGYFEYKPMFVEKLPVPKLGIKEQEKLSELVDKRSASTESKGVEKEIDQFVYTLYGLDEVEISIIEKSDEIS